jgi:hypothetical protein
MRPAVFRPRRLSPVLLVLAALVRGRWRGVETKATGDTACPEELVCGREVTWTRDHHEFFLRLR